jgi:hypothetical protein
MPRTPIDYSNAIIYTISKDDLVYVGSTTEYTKRKSHHRTSCNSNVIGTFNMKLYKTIRENGGWEAFTMKPYKVVSCKNKMELLIEEEKARQELKSTLNSYLCSVNDKPKKIKCDCGCDVVFTALKKHRNSAKHTRLLSLLNTNVSVEEEAKDEGKATGSASLSK